MDTALISAVVVALITTGGNLLINRLTRRDTKQDKDDDHTKMVDNALKVILHDRLYQACRYYLGQGEIDEAGYKNVAALYGAYHAMGGNSTGTMLYEAVEQLWIGGLKHDNKTVVKGSGNQSA